jgi:hypothetical protein
MTKILIKMKPCDCKDFKKGMNQIDEFIAFGYTHGLKYTASNFKYCPWCGKKRTIK